MGKFTNIHKLSKTEQDELFIGFVESLSRIRSSVEAANFVKDLLSESEVLMLARRLQVADLLLQGLTYEQIRKVIKVSFATIAKVQTWLRLYGEGYRTILARAKKQINKEENHASFSWPQVKKKYPMYFWPQLLLEEIVKNANYREKKKLLRVAEELRGKTKIARQLKRILK